MAASSGSQTHFLFLVSSPSVQRAAQCTCGLLVLLQPAGILADHPLLVMQISICQLTSRGSLASALQRE